MYIKFVIGANKIEHVDRNFYTDEDKDESALTLGAGSYINSLDFWCGGNKNISHALVGRYCSLSRELLFVVGFNHNYKAVTTYPRLSRSNISSKSPRQIIVGHDVWIGHGATIMGGVKIGNGAVIGTNAVVAKDIPPYAIAVGNPARVIKYRFDRETVKKLLAIKWWNWDKEKIDETLSQSLDMEKFLETHYSPELEEFPEDDFSRQLRKFTGGGGIYNFIPDFQARKPLWPRIMREFIQAKKKDAVLVIWLDKDSTNENAKALTEAIGESKNILTFKHEENFSPTALRQGTHFITTREMTTLEALDYLWDTDVKIISALDYGIFLESKCKEKPSPTTFAESTSLITSDNMKNFEALDYLWNTDVKILED